MANLKIWPNIRRGKMNIELLKEQLGDNTGSDKRSASEHYKEQDAQFYIELAEKKLGICEKYEQENPDIYRRLIIGDSTFSIRRPTSDGNFEQCSWAIMEALYNKKRNFPNSNIDQILYKALLTEFKNEISPLFLKNCIDCLLYQMNSEKQRTSPFNLDLQTLLEELKNNIQRNYERYKGFEIIEDLENYDQRIEKNCGRHIL